MTTKVPNAWRRMPPLPTTKDLLRMYKIKAKKSLSQNFIMDPRIMQRFVKTAGNIRDFYAIEVGPGPGGITRAILDANVKECHVIEKDPRFLPTLKLIKEAVGEEKLHISMGDCLHYNISKRLEGKVIPTTWDSPLTPNLALFGNLPFNVATPFLIKLLKCMSEQSNIYAYGRTPAVLTFQHEVALRMCAPPKTPERCRLSVIVQNWAEVHYAYNLPGGAFVPPPQVEVGVVKLTPLREPYINLPYKVVDTILHALFLGGKNKYIKTTLRTIFTELGVPMPQTVDFVHQLLEQSDLDPTTTALHLSMEDIRALCFNYQHLKETQLKHTTILDERPIEDDIIDPLLMSDDDPGYVVQF